MTFKEALSFIQQTIERTATAAVKAVKSHTFRVDIGAKRFEVTNLPRIQQVEGEVKVSNQVDLSGEMKRVETQLKELKQTLGTLKPRDEVRVSNFPKQKPFPEPPKRMEIEGVVKVSTDSLKSLLKSLDEVKQAIAKLPTKYPETKFPEIRFPDIPQPLKRVSIDNLETLKGTDPTSYVPVRLTDGEDFYEAIGGAIARSPAAFANSSGQRTTGLVDEDRHVQVDVVSMPTSEIEFPEVQNVAVTNLPETQSVEVTNFPTSVDVANLPDTQRTEEQETPPTASNRLNPGVTLSYNVAGDLIKIEKLVGETTYTKTLSNPDEVVASTKVISSWS